MTLEKYKKKRHFNDTPEPKGKVVKKKAEVPLLFVIQKHNASHLHYDLRLEMEGVLKSWAVPKGPSTDPSIKRLAMHVEDHPYDYKDFEGIIEAGNYGAGEVIIWDEGELYSIDSKKRNEAEKDLLHGYHAGSIKFVVKGKKLKGAYALFKIRGDDGDDGKSWLLVKENDKYVSEKDVTKKNKSVRSGKTIEDMIKENPDRKGESSKPRKSGKITIIG